MKYTNRIKSFKLLKQFTSLVRLFVDGIITETEYRHNLHFLCNEYRTLKLNERIYLKWEEL